MAALTYLLWLTTREGLRPETAAALVRRFGGSRVLLVTGGGSVRRNGAYDAVTASRGVRTAFIE